MGRRSRTDCALAFTASYARSAAVTLLSASYTWYIAGA